MTREPCAYCGQEERYGHNAICVMNTVEELRAEIERMNEDREKYFLDFLDNLELKTEVERLRAENKWLYDQIAAQKRTAGAAAVAALEPKP